MTKLSGAKPGYFGPFGGQFVPEFLYPALSALDEAFVHAIRDTVFQKEFMRLLSDYAGRPTPLYFAQNTSDIIGCKVYFKREDLGNGGSHKINNALGQALLAKYMGKTRIVTETAAGMHGVASTMAANVVGLTSYVFMGVKDIVRQGMNADKIRLLGGKVIPVTRGHGVLKDAVSEALVSWIRDLAETHYLIGSAVGPHPFPSIVAYFQACIGRETRQQILEKEGRLPTALIACGSGGSNAIGMFQAFVDDAAVVLLFVEGGPAKTPQGSALRNLRNMQKHAAAFTSGRVGIFQGAKTILLQDAYGMDRKTESRSAGLNYPARGPQLAFLYSTGRMEATYATDEEVLTAYRQIARLEGLLPAFETCHALAALYKRKGQYQPSDIVIVNFSGRGDKDMDTALSLLHIDHFS